jgi:hypothetical protein
MRCLNLQFEGPVSFSETVWKGGAAMKNTISNLILRLGVSRVNIHLPSAFQPVAAVIGCAAIVCAAPVDGQAPPARPI